MKKFISVFLTAAMLMAGAAVQAEGNSAVIGISNDSFIKVGDTIKVDFASAITAEQAASISVVKLNGTENLVEAATVEDTSVTLSFGDNLEYSSAYKLTVPVTAGVDEEASVYFQTYNKYFRGISKVIVDENFNDIEAGQLPEAGSGSNKNIGKFTSSIKTSDGETMSVKATNDTFGQNGKSLYAMSQRSDAGYDAQQIYLEYYNGRIIKNANGRLVISFKFKSSTGRMMDFRIKTNDGTTTKTNAVFWMNSATPSYLISNLYDTAAKKGIEKGFGAEFDMSAWHEYTSEWDTTDSENLTCVYAAIDGEAVPATQNVVATNSISNTSSAKTIYLDLSEWTKGQKSDVYIDDVKVYVPNEPADTTAVLSTEAVGAVSSKVKIAFSAPVNKTTLWSVTAAPEGGESIAPTAVDVSNDLKTAVLTYSGLAAQTTYDLDTSNITDVFANPVTASAYSITTNAPNMGNIDIAKPVITGEIAPGAVIEASAVINANNTGLDANATIIFALYEGIKLIDLKSETKVIANGVKNEAISTSITIPEKEAHGIYELRAFVWDSESGMKNIANLKSETKTDYSASLK